MPDCVKSAVFFLLIFSCVSARNYTITITDSRLPTPRVSMPALYDGADTIYLVGGQDLGNNVISQLLKYNIASDTIEIAAPSVVPSMYASAVWDPTDDSLYLFGGSDSWGATDYSEIWKIHSSDPETLVKVGDLLTTCAWTASVGSRGEYIYTFGGYSGATSTNLNTVVRFSRISGGTEFVANTPMAIGAASAVWDPGNSVAYIFGGVTNGGIRLNNILMFDEATGAVTNLASVLPIPMGYTCAVLIGTEAYIIGADGGPATPENEFSFIKFNILTREVTPLVVEGFPYHGAGVGCAWVESLNRIYIFGGTFDGYQDVVMYIDMNEEEGSTTPVTTEETTPTTVITTESETPSTTETDEPPTTDSTTSVTEETTAATTVITTESETPSTTVSSTEIEVPSTPSPSSGIDTPPTTISTTEGDLRPTTFPTTESVTPPINVTEAEAPSTSTESFNTTTPSGKQRCNATDKYGEIYEADVGHCAHHQCPGESTGKTEWCCISENTFNGSTPDYSNCSSRWVSDVEDQLENVTVLNPETAHTLLTSMQDNIRNAINFTGNITYFGHEINSLFGSGHLILTLLDNTSAISTVETLTESTLNIYFLLLNFDDPWRELQHTDRLLSATLFLSSTDAIGINLADRFRESNPNSEFYRSKFKQLPDELEVLSGLESTDSKLGLEFPLNCPDNTGSSCLQIEADWVAQFPEKNSALFTGFGLSTGLTNRLFPPPSEKVINGKLMSFKFEDSQSARHLDGVSVRVAFWHDVRAWGDLDSQDVRRKLHDGEIRAAVRNSASCAYWDPTALAWSSQGCKWISSDNWLSICECDHLTSFALIMDLHNYIGKDVALEWLTLILTPISTISLIGCIIVFIYSRNKKQLLKNHPRNDLTLNLCICLLIANMLVLVTMDKHYLHLSDSVCIGSAIALHFTLLCAFSFMALEGLLLARLIFINIFSTGREYAKREKLGVIVVPGLIVGVTCAINFSRGDNGYANDLFCWLNGDYLWAFIGPVAVVVVGNGTILVLSIRKSHFLTQRRKHSLAMQKALNRKARSVRFWIQGAINLTAIMGLTWIFGFLMLINNSILANFFAYIFTIFNACQGLFIFIFHIASNKKVRAEFSILKSSSNITTNDKVGTGSNGKVGTISTN